MIRVPKVVRIEVIRGGKRNFESFETKETLERLMKDEIVNGQFLQGAQGWTLGANWTFDGTGLKHATGAVEAVSQDCANSTHTTITDDFTVYTEGITAGTLTVA